MTKNSALKIVIYDKTCLGPKPYLPGLTHSWIIGGYLFSKLGRFDLWAGFDNWIEALEYLVNIEKTNKISEIQFWGHGKWGKVLIAGSEINAQSFSPASSIYPLLSQLRERLTPESLIWFRTCETFGCDEGFVFAECVANFFHCHTAGHTHIIGPWQSGLYALRPGEKPYWPSTDGLRQGTPSSPLSAYTSQPWHPRTIPCLQMNLPQWAYNPDSLFPGSP